MQTIPGRMGGPGRGGRGRGDAAAGAGRAGCSGPERTAASGVQAAGQGRANQPAAPAADESEQLGGGGRGGGAAVASMAPGLNRVTWNLSYPGPTTFPGMILWGATTAGPAALPGSYEVRLTVDGVAQTQPLRIRKHPLRATDDADLKEQFDLGTAHQRQGVGSEQRRHPDSIAEAADRRSR